MSDYTPTTDEVRDAWRDGYGPGSEFDRWLAQHDAEVRKQVAEEVAAALLKEFAGTGGGEYAAARIAREIGGAS